MDDRDERIAALERAVRLMAEATRDAFVELRGHYHGDTADTPDTATVLAIERALGRLDAVLSPLGITPHDAARPGMGGENGTG